MPTVKGKGIDRLKVSASPRSEQTRSSWGEVLKVRRSSNAWKILNSIAQRPAFKAMAAAVELEVMLPNVYPPLQMRVESGIQKSKREHTFGSLWRSDELLQAIDAPLWVQDLSQL